MKALAKHSQEIFDRLVEGLANVGDNRQFKSEQGGMPLFVRLIGYPRPNHRIISLAHYLEQNGDLVCDLEVTFLFVADGAAYPMTIQQGIPPIYQIAMHYSDGSLHVNEKLQQEITVFCDSWMVNLRDQYDLQ